MVFMIELRLVTCAFVPDWRAAEGVLLLRTARHQELRGNESGVTATEIHDYGHDVVDVDVLENVDVGRTFVDPDPLTVFFVDTLGMVVGTHAGREGGRQTHAHKKQ